MTITYEYKQALYINLTNRCPNACTFCERDKPETQYGEESLWLEREPTVEEIKADLARRELPKYTELVFCGFGEPMERIDALCEVARWVREHAPQMTIRINTNGLSDLIHGRNTAPELAGLIDVLSISLNSATAQDYQKLCRPVFGEKAYEGLLAFAKNAQDYVPKVVLTVVDCIGPEEVEKCRAVAQSIGAQFRVRPYVG